MATKGYASAEAEVAYRRASELRDLVDDSDQVTRVLVSLRTLNQVGGKSIAAKGYGLRGREMAQRTGSRIYIAQASVGLAHTACMMGAFGEARRHVGETLDAYDEADYRAPGDIGLYAADFRTRHRRLERIGSSAILTCHAGRHSKQWL